MKPILHTVNEGDMILFTDISIINSYSASFDFLKNEPDLYTLIDCKTRYVSPELALKVKVGKN